MKVDICTSRHYFNTADNYRVDASKRAIQTFKEHFLSAFATCDSKFPGIEQDRLLGHNEVILNLLRPARYNPKLFTYVYINRQHTYNKKPLVSPGSKAIIY